MILLDRGNCSFTTKVRNVEQTGMKMTVIADNKEEDTENLIMADDGSGHSINIPSFIIPKKDADKIKEALTKTSIYIKAECEMVHPDNRVEYELWYSTILDLNPMLLDSMNKYQNLLSSNALFTPRILSYSCDYCSDSVKEENCLVNGKYCAHLPKHDVDKSI